MRLYVGADHRGFALKKELIHYLENHGYAVTDTGHDHLDPNDDFPQFAAHTVLAILGSDDTEARGILICGSGQGMCMAANRFKGIRACLSSDAVSARAARQEDNSNVLCLPADRLKGRTWQDVVDAWLQTAFEGAPRYIRRIREMDELN